MHVRRKPNDPTISDTIGGDAAARPALVDRDGPHHADNGPTDSPARLLHQQLAARLAGTAPSTPQSSAIANVEPNAKLPVALRITTILTLSAALWSVLYFGIAYFITV